MSFFIASSPHAHNRKSTPDLMKWVAICALPGLIAQTYFFGWGTIIQLVFAITLAVIFEGLVMLARKRHPFSALRDNSAIVTAWLLAVAIPHSPLVDFVHWYLFCHCYCQTPLWWIRTKPI